MRGGLILILLVICIAGAWGGPFRQPQASQDLSLQNDASLNPGQQLDTARAQMARAVSLAKNWDLTSRQAAAELYIDAASMLQNLNSSAERIEALRAAARSLRILGEHPKALAVLEDALTAARRSGLVSEHVSVLSQLALVHFQTGNLGEGKRLVHQARQLRSDRLSIASQADYLVCKAELDYYERNLAESEAGLERAVHLRRSIADRLGEAEAMTSLGQLLMVSGQYDKGIEVLTSAITIAQELGNLRAETLATVAIGHLYAVSSRHREALEAYRRAEQHFPADVDLAGQ